MCFHVYSLLNDRHKGREPHNNGREKESIHSQNNLFFELNPPCLCMQDLQDIIVLQHKSFRKSKKHFGDEKYWKDCTVAAAAAEGCPSLQLFRCCFLLRLLCCCCCSGLPSCYSFCCGLHQLLCCCCISWAGQQSVAPFCPRPGSNVTAPLALANQQLSLPACQAGPV